MVKKTLFVLIFLIATSLASNAVEIITKTTPSDVIALDVWVRVGSRNENYQNNGISHFIEHLIFKGSKKYKTGEIDRKIEEIGGIINAATSKDFTHFYIVVPKEHFETATIILADALTNPSFNEEELEKERRVVLEEILRSDSQPEKSLYDLIYAKSFRHHPYHYSVLGSLATISHLKRDAIVNYFKEHYSGNNVSVIAVGGLPKNAQSVLKREFGKMPNSNNKIDIKKEYLSEKKLLELKKDVKKTYLYIAFSSPDIQNSDSYVMDTMITMLATGRNSILNKEIKEKDQLVDSISVSYPTPIDPNLLIISAICEEKDVETATQKIFAVINNIKLNGVSAKQLNRAKKLIEFDYKLTYSEPKALASHLGYFKTIANNMSYEQNYLNNINKVTNDDLKRVANKYFGYYTIGRIIPASPEGGPEK